MFYKELGKGKTVVLLHGFLENGKMWDNFAQTLSQTHHLIIPDLLGHGQTPTVSNSHTMEMQAQHVIKILNDLEIEKATFIGHSMGGYISMALARDYPDSVEGVCLFFSNTLPDSKDKKEQRLKAIETATRDKQNFIRHSVRGLFNPHKISELESEIHQAREWAMETPIDGIAAALRGMRERVDTTHVLQRSTYPVQIILGAFDAAIDSEAFQNMIPAKENVKIDVLPVGHMGHLEAPDKCLEIIQQFLKQS